MYVSLSTDLIDQFVQATNDEKKEVSDGVAYGTVVINGDATYVQLDGSTMNTPVSTTTNVKHGERVAVLIKNHTATITGNFSSPAARTEEVESANSKLTEFEIAVGKKVSVEELTALSAFLKFLLADEIVAEDIVAAKADINALISDKITVEDLQARYADIENLKADLAQLGVANVGKAVIKDLEVTDQYVRNLEADYGEFKELAATKAEVGDLVADTIDAQIINGTALDTKYANVDFANISDAAITKIFASTGLIDNLTVGDGMIVTGELAVVSLNADNIKTGIMTADRLMLKGTDGIYYQLNLNALGEAYVSDLTEEEQAKLQNGIHGENIIANSITAKHISVDDLTAFGATIANFTIVGANTDAGTPGKLYSGVKETVDNDTRGIYQDSDGQFAVGDSNNYLKFYNDNGTWMLAIRSSQIILGSGKTVEEAVEEVRDAAQDAQATASGAQETTNNLLVTVDDAFAKAVANEADIVHLNETIQLIKGNYTTISVDANGDATIVSQDGTSYTIAWNNMNERVDEASEHREYITFNKNDGDPHIRIAAKDARIKLQLTNDSVSFLDGEDPIVDIFSRTDDGDIGLTTSRVNVTDELRHENSTKPELGNFAWKVRDNGNFGLSWKPSKQQEG